jgi:hypothetical protein
LALKKASFMTDPSQVPETPEVTEIVSFLRRFADMMSNGYNAKHLHRAADLLETLTASVVTASDEEKLWRYKYETVTHHADELEAERDTLKNDIEGHLGVTTAILSERDDLKATLHARETALAELDAVLNRERGEFARKTQVQEEGMAALRGAFDQERETLKATATGREQELDQLRQGVERERDELKAVVSGGEKSLTELGLVLDRERANLQVQRKVHEDEIEALRVVFGRERDELQAKIVSLEAKRAELGSAVERLSDLRNQTAAKYDGVARSVAGKSGSEAEVEPQPAEPGDRGAAIGETSAMVPKATLRQARAQFEFLARECVSRGDIASQVMCELAAYTLDLVLTADRKPTELPVGEMARNILAPAGAS